MTTTLQRQCSVRVLIQSSILPASRRTLLRSGTSRSSLSSHLHTTRQIQTDSPARLLASRQRFITQSRLARPSQPLVRSFHASSVASHGHLSPYREGEGRRITFIDKEGRPNEFVVGDGNNLLDIAQANDLDMEGACGGSCACSTCHVIVENEEMYDKMEPATDDEDDMLDLAYGLTETSRLGCQVCMSKDLDGLIVRLPSMSRNVQASDFETKKA